MAEAASRRDFLAMAAAATVGSGPPKPLILPVHRVMDGRARCTPEQLRRFWWRIWPEAVRDFGRCGIQLQCTDEKSEIKLSPGDRPQFGGLARGAINMVVTDRIPMEWDHARGLAGATGLYHGYILSVIALQYAHGHQIPFVAVNTCVHELLHVLLGDIFVSNPKWFQVDMREQRDDWSATRLWLFRDGAAIRQSAEACVRRLRQQVRPSGTGSAGLTKLPSQRGD